MNIQNLTEEQKTEALSTLNTYWQSQTLKPLIGHEFISANKLLDVYDHDKKLRVCLRLENSKVRLMMIDKELIKSGIEV